MATRKLREERRGDGGANPFALARAPEDDEPWAVIERDPRAFVEAQLPAARRILQELRAVILDGAPRAIEEVKWHALFFSHAGLLCFLDPGRDTVKLGFVRGAELAREHGDLLAGSGRSIRSIRVKDGQKLPKKRLIAIVRAAVRLNEASAPAKGTPKKRAVAAR